MLKKLSALVIFTIFVALVIVSPVSAIEKLDEKICRFSKFYHKIVRVISYYEQPQVMVYHDCSGRLIWCSLRAKIQFVKKSKVTYRKSLAKKDVTVCCPGYKGTPPNCYGGNRLTVTKRSSDDAKTDVNFFIGIPEHYYSGDEISSHQISLHISTSSEGPVDYIIQTSSEVIATGTVNSHLSASVSLNSSLTVRTPAFEYRELGIHVKATDVVSLFAYSSGLGAVGEYPAIPYRTLDISEYVYYAVSTEGREGLSGLSGSFGQILLIGTEDLTDITIVPTKNVKTADDIQPSIIDITAGESKSVTLHKFETLLIVASNSIEDLTGTKIASDKPLSVISGHECGFIPKNEGSCEHVLEQIPPTVSWGRQFLISPYKTRGTQYYKVVASENSTKVRHNCANSITEFTLSNPGDFENVITSNGVYCYIEANSPVLVTQMSPGGELDDGVGDPAISVIPPMEKFIQDKYSFKMPNVESITNVYLNIVTKKKDTFSLSGSVLSLMWTNITDTAGNTVGYAAQVTSVTADSDYVLSSSSEETYFYALVYGFGKYKAFSFTSVYSTALECNEGYKLGIDGILCEDVDECSTSQHNCGDQICTNTVGSFLCDCSAGFELDENMVECVAKVVLCPNGQELVNDICVNCTAGYHSLVIDNIPTCVECERGTFNGLVGQAACTPCPEHMSTMETGRVTNETCQDLCPPHTSSSNGFAATGCLNCSEGYYQFSYGSTSCIQCSSEDEDNETFIECYVESGLTQRKPQQYNELMIGLISSFAVITVLGIMIIVVIIGAYRWKANKGSKNTMRVGTEELNNNEHSMLAMPELAVEIEKKHVTNPLFRENEYDVENSIFLKVDETLATQDSTNQHYYHRPSYPDDEFEMFAATDKTDQRHNPLTDAIIADKNMPVARDKGHYNPLANADNQEFEWEIDDINEQAEQHKPSITDIEVEKELAALDHRNTISYADNEINKLAAMLDTNEEDQHDNQLTNIDEVAVMDDTNECGNLSSNVDDERMKPVSDKYESINATTMLNEELHSDIETVSSVGSERIFRLGDEQEILHEQQKTKRMNDDGDATAILNETDEELHSDIETNSSAGSERIFQFGDEEEILHEQQQTKHTCMNDDEDATAMLNEKDEELHSDIETISSAGSERIFRVGNEEDQLLEQVDDGGDEDNFKNATITMLNGSDEELHSDIETISTGKVFDSQLASHQVPLELQRTALEEDNFSGNFEMYEQLETIIADNTHLSEDLVKFLDDLILSTN